MVCLVLGSELGLETFVRSGDGDRGTDLALYRFGGVLALGGVRLRLTLTTGSSLCRSNRLLRYDAVRGVSGLQLLKVAESPDLLYVALHSSRWILRHRSGTTVHGLAVR